MNTALAMLLADWVHHWDAETPDSEKRLDLLEAKQHLQGLVRLLLDEDLTVRIARRLHEHQSREPWDDLDARVRNSLIINARNVLDALRDEITEDRAPDTLEEAELDQILDATGEIGILRCAWCGHELTLTTTTELAPRWVDESESAVCELSPTDTHDPN